MRGCLCGWVGGKEACEKGNGEGERGKIIRMSYYFRDQLFGEMECFAKWSTCKNDIGVEMTTMTDKTI